MSELRGVYSVGDVVLVRQGPDENLMTITRICTPAESLVVDGYPELRRQPGDSQRLFGLGVELVCGKAGCSCDDTADDRWHLAHPGWRHHASESQLTPATEHGMRPLDGALF